MRLQTLFVVVVLGLALTLSVSSVPFAHADTLDCTSSDSARAQCQKDYDKLQEEIASWQKVLDSTRAQKNTLKGDVTALTAQINQAEAQIKAKNIQIANLGTQINSKTAHINQLVSRIDAGHESLASLLRQQNQADDLSLPEIVFSASTAFALFQDVDSLVSVQRNLDTQFDTIRSVKSQTETERQKLAEAQNATVDAKYEVQTKEQQISKNKTEKSQLLAITTSQESQYQKVLAERQAKAAQIRNALFPLRDAASIQFKDALAFAQAAQAKTGVDPAFILAELTQESNLGSNVGQCYMNDPGTGNGIGKNTGKAFPQLMNLSRDVGPFIALAKRLGFDYATQVVSCSQPGGYGGAMGPAQFLPSTWSVYEARIASYTGHSVPNPWDPGDAIMAMAIYMADLGAAGGSYSAEHTAAAKYYAGGRWATAGQTYANQVMAKVATYQSSIDFLKDN